MRLQTEKKSSRYASLACWCSRGKMVVLVLSYIRTLVVRTNVDFARR